MSKFIYEEQLGNVSLLRGFIEIYPLRIGIYGEEIFGFRVVTTTSQAEVVPSTHVRVVKKCVGWYRLK